MSQAQRHRPRRKTSRSKKRAGGSSWGMLIIGLISGSILAALFFAVQQGDSNGWGSGLKALFTAKPGIELPVEPDAPVKTALPKPTFDFYTLLPKIERIVPETDLSANSVTKPRKNVTHVLQAASYTNFNDADRLKAQLTITGFDANVKEVSIEGRGKYFRVRLGPYTNWRELKTVKKRLADRGIEALIIETGG